MTYNAYMIKKLEIILAIVIILAALGISGYLYWQYKYTTPGQRAANALQKALKSIGAGVALPDISLIDESIGENLVEVNPIDKTNPFKDIRVNPFE